MDTLEVLIAARKLIEKAEHWTQGALARNVEGLSIDPMRRDAVVFCPAGAIMRVTRDKSAGRVNAAPAVEAFARAATRRKFASWLDAVWFNNSKSHRRVINAWDRAIAAERAKVPA